MKPSFNSEQLVEAQLCQMTLKQDFLNTRLSVSEKLDLSERLVSDDGPITAQDFNESETVADLFLLLKKAKEVRLASSAINILLSSRMSEDLWVSGTNNKNGFRLTDETEGGRKNDHVVLVGKKGSVSAQLDQDNGFVFNINVKSYMRFKQPLTLDMLLKSFPQKSGWDQMTEWQKLKNRAAFPVYDVKANGRGNYTLSHFRKPRLDEKAVPKSKTNFEEIGAMLVRLNRLEDALYQKAKARIPSDPDATGNYVYLACCKPYQSDRVYSFRLSDIAVAPSMVLIGFVNEAVPDLVCPILRDAAEATAEAKSFIDENLADREMNFELAEAAMFEFMERAPTKQVRLRSFDKVTIERRKTALETPTSRKLRAPENEEFAIIYLCDKNMDEDRRKTSLDKFLKYYTGEGGVYAKSGIKFKSLIAETDDARINPRKVVDDLIAAFGNKPLNVIVAWQRWKNSMPPKTPLEFELMRRGIACQHVIDERTGGQKDAVKQPAIRAAVYAKFLGCDPVGGRFFEDVIAPFDAALSLDVSRYRKLEVVSPIVAYTSSGMIACMPESLDLLSKERRSAEEVAKSINDLAHKLPCFHETGRCSILLIRDGFANEDWPTTLELISPGIALNVVSVRKNLLSIFSNSFDEGYYAVDYVTSDTTGIYGVNAALKTGATLKMVHAIEQIVAQTPVSMEDMLDILIALARKNVTLESGVCSLPVPQHLADRTAGELRKFLEDNHLKAYLNRTYPDEINSVGSIEKFIYASVRTFMLGHQNGWAWAI